MLAPIIDPIFVLLEKLSRGLKCRHCGVRLKGRVSGPFHSGFSAKCTAYCDHCGRSLHFGYYGECFEKAATNDAEFEQSREKKAAVESQLVSCACGGSFQFDAAPLCPECRKPLREPDELQGAFLVVEPALDEEKGDRVLKDSGG